MARDDARRQAVLRADSTSVTLDDKWILQEGRALISGTQAIARVLLTQARRDRAAGYRTGGYVSGYRGSPLGGVDAVLWSVGDRLDEAGIRFQPGVNEELAATAVHGSQQVGLLPDPACQGVFALWYGKGPGVDRAVDALKHGNFRGASPLGGVLCVYGDDHPGKSSTIVNQSEQAMASCLIPSLYPADAQEILRYGLLGIALSRHSGAWVGLKCVNETVEQTMTADMGEVPVVIPPEDAVPAGVHARFGAPDPMGDEQVALAVRLPRVHDFVRANALDRADFVAPRRRLGIVTAGKSYGDVRQALALIGLDDRAAADLGLSLYKVGCIWPLEPQGLAAFAAGHDALLVVEEKKAFLEPQIASVLINRPGAPRVYGKADERGAPLLSSIGLLEPADIAQAIAGRLALLGIALVEPELEPSAVPATDGAPPAARRIPFFCSGCPHNRSTQIPGGSLSMAGIGCHAMARFVRPQTVLPPVQMGGEGANWLGIAPFTGTAHIFQNLGDGTYYHSGLLAIRAAVAAKVNITYKILYNDAVAMTGGQPIDGPLSVAGIVHQVRGEGVADITIVSDNPDHHRADRRLPRDIRIAHRDELDAVQRRLRTVPGVTLLIYEQTCAAEKRRRRKRGTYPDPPKRMFIAKSVCEGCGDCSVQSTCVSVQPVEDAFGTKRRIDQSGCNKDYSCANGFCPSFITVRGAGPRRPEGVDIGEDLFAALPPATCVADGADLIVAGIGGSGIITAAALIGMAAHLDGKAASLFDMTGLAQKNGAVYSHVRVARSPRDIPCQRIGRGGARLLLAFDAVAALGPEVADALCTDTGVVLNTDLTPTALFQFNREAVLDERTVLDGLAGRVGEGRMVRVDATSLAGSLLGDTMMMTSLLLGVAAQHGLLPVTADAMEAAVRLNGVAVAANLRAFRLGRLFVHDPAAVQALVQRLQPAAPEVPRTLEEIVAHRSAHLVRYQGPALAERYRALVARVVVAEQRVAPATQALSVAVARNYAKLLAYKDEYEVARLLTDPALIAEIARTFDNGAGLSFNLAPPVLGGKPVGGRPPKREFPARIRPLLKLLAACRGLRGTWADPFGRTAERRMERRLIADYEALVARVLDRLTAGNHAAALAALGLADAIRGYGPVKEAAIAAYRARITALEAGMDNAGTSDIAPAGQMQPRRQ